jgi:hypothetical protein
MLSDEQMAEMAPRVLATLQTPGWQDYVKVVEAKIQASVEAGFSGTPEDLRYHQGAVDGLRAAVLSGEDVLNITRQLTGEKREARLRSRAAGVQSSSFE